MATYRVIVSIMPNDGILDPQGRAVEASLASLDAANVHHVRVGRRVEVDVEAGTTDEAWATVDRLSRELLANPLIESWEIEGLHTPAPLGPSK